jgi:hypothetical protein
MNHKHDITIIHGFFLLGFQLKKYPKVKSVKKTTMSIGQIVLYMSNASKQSNWTLSF